MPQVIALAIAGAGLYAACRWLSRGVRRAIARAGEAQEELARKARQNVRAPKDLGELVWDEEAEVYRPSRQA